MCLRAVRSRSFARVTDFATSLASDAARAWCPADPGGWRNDLAAWLKAHPFGAARYTDAAGDCYSGYLSAHPACGKRFFVWDHSRDGYKDVEVTSLEGLALRCADGYVPAAEGVRA